MSLVMVFSCNCRKHFDKHWVSDIETWSFDRVFNKKNFHGKGMQKLWSKN